MKAHPEVEKLQGKELLTAPVSFLLLGSILSLAYIVQTYQWNWLYIILLAYSVGAFINHCQWVMVHELTHDLAFDSPKWNEMLLLVNNLAHIIPSGISFRYHHRNHHAYLNETYTDMDVPSEIEDRIFGHTIIGKATWISFFSVIQSVRTLRSPQPFEWALVYNVVGNVIFTIMVATMIGAKGLGFMILSSLLSIGLLLHPLGARWIAEHWVFSAPQETYSYYGPINTVALNIGYHNEHHDFMRIPWTKLPVLRSIAPEFYNSLYSHSSYVKVLWVFITDPRFTLRSRVVRWPKGVKSD